MQSIQVYRYSQKLRKSILSMQSMRLGHGFAREARKTILCCRAAKNFEFLPYILSKLGLRTKVEAYQTQLSVCHSIRNFRFISENFYKVYEYGGKTRKRILEYSKYTRLQIQSKIEKSILSIQSMRLGIGLPRSENFRIFTPFLLKLGLRTHTKVFEVYVLIEKIFEKRIL